MKSRRWMWTVVVYLFATLAVTVGLAAQDNPAPEQRSNDRQRRSRSWPKER